MDPQTATRSLVIPALFPASPVWGDQYHVHYEDNTNYTVTFVTEKAAVTPYLPDGVVVPDAPVVAVTYSTCRGVREMAGDGYNLVSIGVLARFEGEQDHEEGDFTFVIWESKFAPVVIGRDVLGYPKLVAEIPDPRQEDGRLSWRVSENGVCFLEGEVWDLEPLPPDAVTALTAASHSDFGSGSLHMTYKRVPSPGVGDGPVIADVVGVVHREDFKQAWTCKGSVTWHEVDPKACYFNYGIIEALRALPVVAWGDCLVTRGPHVIEFGPSRKLV